MEVKMKLIWCATKIFYSGYNTNVCEQLNYWPLVLYSSETYSNIKQMTIL